MIKFKNLCFDGHACMSHLNAGKYVQNDSCLIPIGSPWPKMYSTCRDYITMFTLQ